MPEPESRNVPKSPGKQHPFWRSYYERVWGVRAEFMRKVIAEGETDPMRVIKALEKRERFFALNWDFEWFRLSFDDEDELLPTGLPAFRKVAMRGQYVKVPYYTSAANHAFIVDYLERGSFDCLVELGCGYGRNLFEVFYGGSPDDIDYVGAELTASGVEMVETLAGLIPRMRLHATRFDFLEPDFAFLKGYENVLVFTHHAIEQVTELGSGFFANLARAAPRVAGIHFEPFGFQLAPALGPATRHHKDNIGRTAWNVNLERTLTAASDAGAISIRYLAAESSFSDNPENPTSIAVWESVPP